MKPVALTLSSRIPFGKYENRLVSDILISDPRYLKWLWVEKKAIAPDTALEQRLRLTPSDFAVAGMKLPKANLKENMKVKQLREAIRQIIRKELNENQPAKSPTPSRPEPTTLPKPGVDKPDEKRRRIGNPDVKPAPKNLKEEEMIDKITARFMKAKQINELLTLDDLEKLSPKNKPAYTDEQISKMTLKQAELALKKGIWDVPQNKKIRAKLLSRIKSLK
jgi:hypothetical protein